MARRLKKAGTMQQVASEGTNFLKRSWGDSKYDLVQSILKNRDEALYGESSEKKAEPAPKKAKLVKSGTMAATAKVNVLLRHHLS